MVMAWVYLLLAILLEIAGTTLMKMSEGLSKLVPTIGMFASYFLCFVFLSFAIKKIPISVAYAIWSAVGILIISAIGFYFFKESFNLVKIVSIALIVIGVVGLQLSSNAH